MAQIPVNISAAGDNTVIPAQTGRYIRISRLVLSLVSETTVQFKSGSQALSGPQTALTVTLDETGSPWYITNKDQAFVISLGAAIQTGGTVWFEYI